MLESPSWGKCSLVSGFGEGAQIQGSCLYATRAVRGEWSDVPLAGGQRSRYCQWKFCCSPFDVLKWLFRIQLTGKVAVPREAASLMEALKDAESGRAQRRNGDELDVVVPEGVSELVLEDGVSPSAPDIQSSFQLFLSLVRRS